MEVARFIVSVCWTHHDLSATHHILVPPPPFARSLNVSPTIHYATFGTDRPMSYTAIEVQPAKQTWIERKIPGAQVPEALLRTGVSEALRACPPFVPPLMITPRCTAE